MYKNKYKATIAIFHQPLNDDNKPIGQRQFTRFSDGGFELNEYGYVRNDISQLLSVQNELSFNRAIQRFKENTSSIQNFPAGMTHEQLISELRPRWCQLPYQQRAFAEYLTEERAKLILDEIDKYNKVDEKVNIDSTPFDSSVPTSSE